MPHLYSKKFYLSEKDSREWIPAEPRFLVASFSLYKDMSSQVLA